MQEKDYDPIERMRHRDTDGDGVADYVDGNGYTKPSDQYRYRNISSDDFEKLNANGFDVARNCRKSKTEPGFILRFTEKQATEIDRILKTVINKPVIK